MWMPCPLVWEKASGYQVIRLLFLPFLGHLITGALRLVLQGQMARGFDVNKFPLVEEAKDGGALSSSPKNSTTSSFQMDFCMYSEGHRKILVMVRKRRVREVLQDLVMTMRMVALERNSSFLKSNLLFSKKALKNTILLILNKSLPMQSNLIFVHAK
ncbi:hypothetical protein Patl1_32966 [Pistacia atlantica]|uniref:Uncharacterized protein n=1 Tax=Pistacia atlantica TaxID=434234 RepID=A0ACC1AR96_9ROSI|nr:hypothetical protein Patl1_32966 [Pistacia atlantica]